MEATLKKMTGLVREFKKNPAIRYKALELTSNLKQKDYAGEIAALFEFVRDDIRYVRDIRNVETIQWPTQTMEQASGDCDDKVTLLASLLETIGHPTRFRVVGFTSADEYQHVYLETKLGPRWVSLETTENVPMGWEPPGVVASLPPWYN